MAYHDQKEQDRPIRATILIAGCTNPPKNVKAADKSRDSGSYLGGIRCDMSNMEEEVQKKSDYLYGELFDILRGMNSLKKSTVLERIRKCAERPTSVIYIYYTGHGQTDTGNWCFADGVVTLKEVIGAVRSSQKKHLRIYVIADCCYSGNWASDLKEYEGKETGIDIWAASRPGKVAWDSKEGGYFTLYTTHKKKKSAMPKLKRSDGYIDRDGKYLMKYRD